MRFDHLSFAAGPEGLRAAAAELGGLLGAEFTDGGFHPRFGTRNKTLALTNGQYVEIVEVLDHPAAEKAPFGRLVRERSEQGGGWLGWVVRTDDLTPFEQRLGRTAVHGSRHRPDGALLEWRQLGIKGLQNDPQLPFFVQWLSAPELHPAGNGSDIELVKLEISGDHERVDHWLGGRSEEVLSDLQIEWSAPHGQPGLDAAVFTTAAGTVRI
ncbi:MAG: VOC family protein [Propionibacteriaceae bacterium]